MGTGAVDDHIGDGRKLRRRRHDAETTRGQILAAAGELFGKDGYGEVSLRRIAAAVGVDAAMIIRHFGSKEKLFAEAMQRPDLMTSMLAEMPRAAFGEQVVRYILDVQGSSREYHMLVALLRSASHRPAADSLPGVAGSFTAILARWLGGKDADLRAALIGAQLVGLLVMRRLFAHPALASKDEREAIVSRVAPGIQALVEG